MAYLTAADIEEIKKKKKKKQSSVNTPKYLTNKDIEEILNRKNNVNVAPIKREVPTKKSSAVGTAGRILTGVGTGFLKGSEAIADAMQYGAANVAGWVGADKAKKALIENAKYNSTKVLTGNAEKFYDPIAYKPFKTGGIGSSIAEGIGQVGSMIGSAGLLGAVSKGSKLAQLPKGGKVLNTAKTLLPSAIQGYGSGVTTGLEKGNSFNKSQAYGLGNAVVQAGSEGLFGGIGGVFGKGALDDIVVKGVTNRIKSNLGKNITRIGIKSFGEGLEENIAGVLDPILQKMTIDKNAQGYFTDEDGKFTLNKAGQDFLVGAATSALLQSPSITQKNIDNKQDIKNQPLESNTQTNVQKDTNIPIKAEQVLNVPKNKSNEVILPVKETNKLNNNVAYSENLTEYLKLDEMKENNKDMSKRNEIVDKMNKLYDLLTPKELQVVYKLESKKLNVEDDYQFNEVITKQKEQKVNIPQATQTDLEKPKTTQIEQIFKKIEKDRQGLKINYNTNIGENGIYTKNADGTRNITINPNSPKAIEFVLVHELSHDLANTPEYNVLKQTILDYDKGVAGFQEARASLTSIYKDVYTKQILQSNPNISQQNLDIEVNKMIDEEATNDVLGTMLSDQTYINKLSTTQSNVFQKVYRWISDMLKRISGKESKFLQDVKLKFENAYRQGNVSQVGKRLSQEQDYFMYHRPTEGPQAFDLLQENDEISGPKDIYQNPQYYTGTLNKQELLETMKALNNIKGKPNANIKIYRATNGNKINDGDWITLSKSYAEMHNEGQLDGKGNILEMNVPAKDIRWALDDLAEWGYFPTNEDIRFSKTQDGKWQERLNKTYEPLGIQDKNQIFKPLPTKEELKKSITTTQETKLNIPVAEDIMKIKKVGKFEAPKIIQSSLEADEKYMLNSQDKVKRVGMTKDFYRNMRNLFDKKTADRVTGEFDESKLNNVKLSNELANDLKENVVNKYNIQKGSKDSALIQKYGEGLIGEAELKKQSPNNWQNIIEADKYFRKQYDMLIDKINASRKTIYPNVEKTILEYENKIQDTTQKIRSKQSELKATQKDTTKYENLKNQINSLHLKKQSYIATIESDEILRNKRVEKRQDYYRHFQEMAEGFNALRNILSTSSDIAPKMVGTSDFTKPNAKFSSITQRRTGNKTKYDAIGGMLDYIPTASFMINIDPQIYKIRKMTNDIKNQMGEETYANQAIQFLTEFANTLAGKQNFIDRTTQKILDSVTWGQGRKAIKGLNWLSGRIKSNMIVGNMSSTLSQALNLPQVVGKVKNPKLLMQGLADALNPNTDYSQAQFIMERYKSDIKSQFDTKLIEQPKKLAIWMLGALDQVVTKTGWNALYRQAIEKNIPNPIQYANNNIRDLVAGRGIGEKTILQESKVVSALLPFTVEVGNLNRVLKDFGREKDVAGLFILFIVANLLNKGIEEIGGSGKTFDPIEALKEALTEEDITVLERIGRVGGEILSNLPAGQQIAALYPEYGNKDLGLPTRDKLFGDNDPTRFGTGSMYSKIFDDPVTTLITPWGGTQIKRTTDALKMYNKDLPGSYTDSGKLRFPVKDDKLTKVQAAIFGQYASKEAREYFDKNRRPLSENQVEEVKNSKDWKEAYNLILKQREYDALGRKYEKYVKEGKSTKELQKEIDNYWK